MGCGWGVGLWYAGAGGLNPPVMGPIVKLFPYNFTEETYRTYLTANEKNIILKPEYSPAKRIPLDPKHQTANRYTVLRLAKQSGFPDRRCL